jgi:glyoxylase I family protein
MEPRGVHHVAINVSDVDAAVGFYVGVLGFRLRQDRPDFGISGAWLDVGNQQVHLVEAPVPQGRGQHFAVQVDALDEVVADLRRRGVSVSDPIPVGTSRQAFVDDPSGNAIELHEVGPAAG